MMVDRQTQGRKDLLRVLEHHEISLDSDVMLCPAVD